MDKSREKVEEYDERSALKQTVPIRIMKFFEILHEEMVGDEYDEAVLTADKILRDLPKDLKGSFRETPSLIIKKKIAMSVPKVQELLSERKRKFSMPITESDILTYPNASERELKAIVFRETEIKRIVREELSKFEDKTVDLLCDAGLYVPKESNDGKFKPTPTSEKRMTEQTPLGKLPVSAPSS